jgi:methyl-accepting chemotaxis protein
MQETLQSLGPIFLAALVVFQIIVTVILILALNELRGLQRRLSLFERKAADLSRSIVAELQGPLAQISSALEHLGRDSSENMAVLISELRMAAAQISATLHELSSRDQEH